MKKLLFIYNPHSGKGNIRTRLFEVIDIMAKAGYEITVHPTQARGDAKQCVIEADGQYDRIVCSGGDGTLDEVVTGMMQCQNRTPIGYIPAGSTNDFANSLKIPKSMRKSTEVAVGEKQFSCDVGAFNQDSFIYVAAFGIFTAVSYQTNQELKNILGHAAYILEGAKSLVDIQSYCIRVESNGEVYEDEFIYGMISNSTSVGGFKNLTGKNVKLDDGLFEVTLIKKPKNPIELNEIIFSLTTRRDETDLIYSFKTDEIRFYPETTIPWTLDGEYGGEHQVVTVRNRQRALEFMVR